MTHPAKALIEELVAGLPGVTEGPWRLGAPNLVDFGEPPTAPYIDLHPGAAATSWIKGYAAYGVSRSDDGSTAANAAHIARCSPPTIRTIAEGYAALEAEVERLTKERDEARKGNYIPGEFGCPKCGFCLSQFSLRASDGAVSDRDQPGEKCPNDGSPLWRVTWKERSGEHYERAMEEMRARKAAEAALAKSREEGERLREALRRIERWSGEFPETGQFWPNVDGTISDRPMSYGACYGSNGERDYMRSVARRALSLAAGNATGGENG